MIRFLKAGDTPKNVLCSFDKTTAGDVLGQLGENVGGGSVLTINGRGAQPSDPVKPGDTVSVQPQARNG
ncbi:hypothetical protein IT396_02670 [Candidatus Nomurabacteria bacterium]|nr:hypothetical protein [Candidatus Nomurabacteria bacterium]